MLDFENFVLTIESDNSHEFISLKIFLSRTLILAQYLSFRIQNNCEFVLT
jgi:hypothetical protein